MIVYLVTAAHGYTMRWFLGHWAPGLNRHVQILDYESLPLMGRLPVASYIFSDIDRLTPARRTVAARVWEQLAASGAALRLLNHPTRSLGRYELLTALFESGRNRFRAARLPDAHRLRPPVFVREADDHWGSLTSLLHGGGELASAIAQLRARGWADARLIAVEFCNTADARGLYRKYSAFVIEDRIIPRHLMHGRKWILKEPDVIDATTVAEEQEYLAGNPHAEVLREVFRLAGISYGRIDYALLDGQLQVWEINTNPVLIQRPSVYSKTRIPMQQRFAERIVAVFEAMDSGSPPPTTIPIQIDPHLVAEALAEPRQTPR